MPYRIESDRPLSARVLHPSAFEATYHSRLFAAATVMEADPDPVLDNARVVDTETGKVVWRPCDPLFDLTGE